MTPAVIHKRLESLVGLQFGYLGYVRPSEQRGDGSRLYAVFACDCGREIDLPVSRVKAGARQHCGCKANRKPNLQHGMRTSREYSCWVSMKNRCLNQDSKDYARWGGRGVSVHPDWVASFEAFFSNVGRRPIGTTLDRIDNTKGYEPGNVRWATASEQGRNRSDSWNVEIDGVMYESLLDAAKAHGVSETTVVRWCDGYRDTRRSAQLNGGVRPSKQNCRRWRKYAPRNY